MSAVRVLLCGVVLVLASLAAASSARAEWFEYHAGWLGPGNDAWTCCSQERYAKSVYWSPVTKCAKTAYSPFHNTTLEYYVVLECDGYIQDNRDSGQPISAYCKNTPGGSGIAAYCYTCINTPGSCP